MKIFFWNIFQLDETTGEYEEPDQKEQWRLHAKYQAYQSFTNSNNSHQKIAVDIKQNVKSEEIPVIAKINKFGCQVTSLMRVF